MQSKSACAENSTLCRYIKLVLFIAMQLINTLHACTSNIKIYIYASIAMNLLFLHNNKSCK